MKVLVIGGVAAGPKVAAKLMRTSDDASVTLITREKEISYAGCGLPYYIGGVIKDRSDLTVITPEKFASLTGVEVRTGRNAYHVDPENRIVLARDDQGNEESYEYDELVIAVGASPFVPPIENADAAGVFTLRNPDDAQRIRTAASSAHNAVVVGAGLIGLELAESLHAMGLNVTVAEAAPTILPGILDPEFSNYAKRRITESGIRILTGASVTGFSKQDHALAKVHTSAGTLPADVAILSVGVRPNTKFLEDTGIEMNRGAIIVDSGMHTSVDHIWAAGDCAQVFNRVTGEAQWSPMGSSANLEGRILAGNLAGERHTFGGVLGTTAVRLLDNLNCAKTGLTESAAVKAGYDVVSAVIAAPDKPTYYPGSNDFIIKLIADKKTRRLLGMQALGAGETDKLADIMVMALSMKATADDLADLDFSYAPPFSTAIHPISLAAHVLANKMDGVMISMTPAEYATGMAKGWHVIDATSQGILPGAMHVAVSAFSGSLQDISKDDPILLVCLRGKQAYLLQRRLIAAGYTHTAVLEGGTTFSDVRIPRTSAISKDEITRVKGLGFLMDKRSADLFNGRVITRNGKITTAESRAITEAAEMYGSGEVAMTSRLTIEIQGVPFDNIEPLRAYLANAGLETGGTGSKVRPVVSCKGTTCQYGLIDTFELSREIHERFYVGYHDVKLPHKFKIAVGGCPNNCVKPDLNDLGIIGQRVPLIDYDRCRGCKVCRIESACPIKVAHLENGRIQVDPDACNHCGRCIGQCPFHAFENYTNGYRIYIGGRWGKRAAQGRMLEPVFTDRETVLNVVEKAILLFREQGLTGERFADTIARIGFENVQAQLLSDDLLARKTGNLAAKTHLTGGATC